MEQGSKSLRGINIFSTLSDDELQDISAHCTWREYRPREQVIDPQADTNNVYFVILGRVRIVDFSALGQEISFDDLYDGACFGEMASIDGQPRSAGVVAVTRVLLASMLPERFRELLMKYPSVSFHLIQELARIIRMADSRVMDLSTLGANHRVCAELLRQAQDVTTDDVTAAIRPIPIHGEMASRVSTTRETVARTLNDLARKGMVERTKDALLIHDLVGLVEMVNEMRYQDRRTGSNRREIKADYGGGVNQRKTVDRRGSSRSAATH